MSFKQEKAQAYKEFIEILNRYKIDLKYAEEVLKHILKGDLSFLPPEVNKFIMAELEAWKEKYYQLLRDEKLIKSL